jgi:hypothetical protein
MGLVENIADDPWPERMTIEGRMIGWETARAKCRSPLGFAVFVLALIAAAEGCGQTPPAGGQVSTPQSSIEKPGDTGVRAHTNTQIFIPNRGPEGARAPPGGGDTGPPQAPGAERGGGGVRPQ